MATPVQDIETPPPIRHLSHEESWDFFDRSAQELMGMSGEEFFQRWGSGEWDGIADDPEHWDILYLAMMIDSGR